MQSDYGMFLIGDLSVYAPHGTPVDNLTMQHVVYEGKTSNTVQLSPTQSMTHPLFKRQESIDVSYTHSFATSDAGHAQLPHQVLSDGYVMTDDGYVFPVEMSDSIFTKDDPLYELGDGTPMCNFLVKKPTRVRVLVVWAVSVHRSRCSTMTTT